MARERLPGPPSASGFNDLLDPAQNHVSVVNCEAVDDLVRQCLTAVNGYPHRAIRWLFRFDRAVGGKEYARGEQSRNENRRAQGQGKLL